jgi:hypothetical protein
VCTKCGVKQPRENFYNHKDCRGGVSSQCKKCVKKAQKCYYNSNRDNYRVSHAKWYDANKDRRNMTSKRYYNDPKNAIRIWARQSIQSHRGQMGFEVNISSDDLEILAKKTTNCIYCDVKLDYSRGKGKIKSNSPALDRRYNENVMTINNIDIICSRCSVTKSNRTRPEFIQYCDDIVKKFKGICAGENICAYMQDTEHLIIGTDTSEILINIESVEVIIETLKSIMAMRR